ncbi:MAG TPA: YraN family protein [Acidimicrobiia bacterium]|mgnify:FL=1|jgi:putative endonuclease|nr:YraN family protein [Acidimicrobiia bacterium]HIL47074.1 YraN family protein [Acidimicrobiia bacterium]
MADQKSVKRKVESTAPHLALGKWGENRAERFYRSEGFRTLGRNWRCPEGEIDLILVKGSLVVFCEVKTRRSLRFGHPAEAVGAQRQRRLRHAAMVWRQGPGRRWAKGNMRFDVVAIFPGHLERIEGAF